MPEEYVPRRYRRWYRLLFASIICASEHLKAQVAENASDWVPAVLAGSNIRSSGFDKSRSGDLITLLCWNRLRLNLNTTVVLKVVQVGGTME